MSEGTVRCTSITTVAKGRCPESGGFVVASVPQATYAHSGDPLSALPVLGHKVRDAMMQDGSIDTPNEKQAFESTKSSSDSELYFQIPVVPVPLHHAVANTFESQIRSSASQVKSKHS